MKPLDKLLELCHAKIFDLKQVLDEAKLGRDCLKACIAVYKQHGMKHPSTFGGGSSIHNENERVEEFEADLKGWEACLAYLLDREGECATIVR